MSVLDEFRLDGSHALVTGAGRGLGRQMAVGLAEAGADVTIADLDAEGAEATAEAVREIGASSTAVRADVSDEAEVEAMVATATDRLGPIDTLVNNAGVSEQVPAEEHGLEDWQSIIDVNLTGVFLCAKHVGRQLLERDAEGTIVNMASVSGFVANFPQPQIAYNASKAGVVMVTRSLASEWATEGIRVNAIAPGYMRTEMVADAIEKRPGMGDVWRDATPIDRLGRPREIKPLVVYLASDASSYVTGEVAFMDGGLTIR